VAAALKLTALTIGDRSRGVPRESVTKVVTVRTFKSLPLAVYSVGGGVDPIITRIPQGFRTETHSTNSKHEQP
jgi:hypothetical protein